MDLSRLVGHAKTSFHHHPKPLMLRTRNGSSISLLDVCKAATPPCTLNPLLFNGHLQTFWTAVTSQDIPIYYKRHVFSSSDPSFAGTFAVDFVVSAYENTDDTLPSRTAYFSNQEFEALGSDDTKPMLIALHGLSGGSHEIYLRCVLEPLIKAGWEACVVNSRGCAMSKITSSVLYNARATWDVRQVVKWCHEKWPNRKLFGIGFSLGANIMTNYLGEDGDRCLLNAAVICSSPWNLDASSLALQRTWLGLNVYSRTMGSSMKELFETHVDQISKNPRIDVTKVRNIKYLHEFDRELQCPTWGYPTEGAYYRDASSTDSLLAVRIPLFAINAEDDPVSGQKSIVRLDVEFVNQIAVCEALPYEEVKQTQFGVLCTTSLGGHLSWFEIGGSRWFTKPASRFLIKMAEEIEAVQSPNVPDFEGRKTCDRLPGFEPMCRKLLIRVEP